MRSAAALVTAYSVGGLGNFFCTGKSYILLDTRFDAILVMYDVRYL